MKKIPDSELLAMACEFDLGPEPILNGRPFWWHFFVDDVSRHSVKVGSTSPGLWGIFAHGGCLDKTGYWQFQGMPSSRPPDFTKRCRYSSVHEAIHYYRRWRIVVENYALSRYLLAGIPFAEDMPMADYKKVIVNYDDIPQELLFFDKLMGDLT